MAIFELEAYKEVSNWSSIPVDFLEPGLEETIESSLFPGILLPAWIDKNIRWYALARDQRQWRMLQPVLKAYVGHTVTTFGGEFSEMDLSVDAEKYLASLELYAVVRLEAPRREKLASRALQRMKETLLARPVDLRPPPMSTAQIISSFDMCLVEGDRKGAVHWLSRLKTELRLDAINLSFTRVKLNATFRDWQSILSDMAFEELCRVKKPTIIAHHLLEAIWHVYLEMHSEDPANLKVAYEEICKNYVTDVLASSGVPSTWVAENFSALLEGFGDRTEVTKSFVIEDEGRSRSFGELEERIGLENDSTHHGDLSLVSDDDQSTGLQDEQHSLDNVTDWAGWLNALERREFSNFNDIAGDLAIAFDVSSFQDPENINEFAETLFDVETERAVSRLNCSLPHLIRWLKSDPSYPRTEMAPLYEVVLWRLIEARRREGEFREAFSEMLTALLELGLPEAGYRGLIDHVVEAVPSGAGTGDVFWLLDIADVLCRFSATDESERKTALNKILSSLEPVTRQMTLVQRSAYLNIGSSAGWEPVEMVDQPGEQTLSDSLKGKLIGIYTLTESAGRQAASVLRALAPDATVEVSSDKVCTPRLTKLSKNADIMVVTTSSAKHAATDCIHQSRATDRILYAAGRGCCSILRAIEENVVET